MVELGIVGARNSGKTTLIEQLVRHLAGNGIRAATVKHTPHSYRFDTPGKDSHRHREAGAGLTVVVSQEEMAVFARPDTFDWVRIQEVTARQFDIWLIEGDRQSDRPKVLLTRELDNLPRPLPSNIVATIGPKPYDALAVHFDSDDISGLGSFVTKTFLERNEETQ